MDFTQIKHPVPNCKIQTICDVDFLVNNGTNGIVPLDYGQYEFEENNGFDAICFLGMTTSTLDCSDRWGAYERNYSFQKRLFIGDNVGTLLIRFNDLSVNIIPLIFGVNIWSYELFTRPNEEIEQNLFKPDVVKKSPFDEPFRNDLSAKELLGNSLLLKDTNLTKSAKYIFGVKISNQSPVSSIRLLEGEFKSCGYNISSVCGINGELKNIDLYNSEFFVKRKYFQNADLLSRRLYQYENDIPDNIKPIDKKFDEFTIKFGGNKYAEILNNLFYANMDDMLYNKLDDDGMTHTSTKSAPSFGRYGGLGTFTNDGAYYEHLWSRDIGRMLIELNFFSNSENLISAAEKCFEFLYDKSLRFDVPNFKRVMNGSVCAIEGQLLNWSGRENDGHGIVMLFIYSLISLGKVDKSFFERNFNHIKACAEFYIWQMDNPEKSNYNGLLYSDGEPAAFGGYDLYSNAISALALIAFSNLAKTNGYEKEADIWGKYASTLISNIKNYFVIEHNGKSVFSDTDELYDSWSYGYKKFAFVMILADMFSLDISDFDKELYTILQNTYDFQKEIYFNPKSGRIMGYGQGFITQTALLLDRTNDWDELVNACAMFCYHKYDHPYIVPEGVICHPNGQKWYRNGDLGNCVQQAEIIKCIRIILGLDNLSNNLNFMPRLPKSFNSIEVKNYKININGDAVTFDINYSRSITSHKLIIKTSKAVKWNKIRLIEFGSNLTYNLNCTATKLESGTALLFDLEQKYLDKVVITNE